jgi:hypothetical protein
MLPQAQTLLKYEVQLHDATKLHPIAFEKQPDTTLLYPLTKEKSALTQLQLQNPFPIVDHLPIVLLQQPFTTDEKQPQVKFLQPFDML